MKRTAFFVCIIAMIFAVACSDRNPEGALEALGEGNLERARAIYAAGVDPDEWVKGQTALTMAACHSSPESIELLLEAGADPNRASRRRQTPLIQAARCGNLPAVRLLIEAGADVNIAAPGGQTALMAAQEAGEEEVVEFLRDLGDGAPAVKSAESRKATGY